MHSHLIKSDEYSFDIGNLSNAIYIVKITTLEESFTKKIIKN